MSLDHDKVCSCALCRGQRLHALPMIQDDRDRLARSWDFWISQNDGESFKLRAGQDGHVGSPRWAALQAIASARIAAVAEASSRAAATIRAQPLADFAAQACAINDSDPLISIYAAPEWAELHEDGQQWVCGLVRETLARAADQPAGIAPTGQPNPIAAADTAAVANLARPDGDLCPGRSTTLDRGA